MNASRSPLVTKTMAALRFDWQGKMPHDQAAADTRTLPDWWHRLSQGSEPSPVVTEGLGESVGGLFDIESPASRELATARCRMDAFIDGERRNAPTSLTLHDQFCAARSFGLATKCQVYTFPRGNPGEMQPDPKARSTPAWSVRRTSVIVPVLSAIRSPDSRHPNK